MRRPPAPIPALPGWSTSPHSRRTLTRHRRAYRPSSPLRTFFPTWKYRMGACGCGPRASSALQETYPSKNRSSCGRPMRHRPRTSLPKRSEALPGGQNRAGTSSPTKTARCNERSRFLDDQRCFVQKIEWNFHADNIDPCQQPYPRACEDLCLSPC
jgi:hypothetical protein